MIAAEMQLVELQQAVTARCKNDGAALMTDLAERVGVLQQWLEYLDISVTNDDARPILIGTKSSLIEVAGCIGLGLVRPATMLMRTQIELMMAWIFFNDHPVEWRYSRETGERYPLYTQTWRYMCNFDKRFEQRFDLLARMKTRTLKEPYGLLSIHVHALTGPALPIAGTLPSIVAEVELCRECLRLQGEVAEFLIDVLFAWFAHRWADLPPAIMEYIKARLGAEEARNMFK